MNKLFLSHNKMNSVGGGDDGIIENPSLAPPLSVVFANKNDNSLVIVEGDKGNTRSFPPSTFEPIGIVVIPGEHGVLKDGTGTVNQCGIISIKPMSYSTPETGATSEGTMYWGGYGTDISGKSDGIGRYDSISDGLTNYQKVACDTTSGTNKTTGLSSSYYAYIPRQGSKGAKPTFSSSSPWAASPYMGDDLMSGGYNEYYGTTDFDTGGVNQNALADFKGIVNTKIITDLATGESWKTLSSLSNKSDAGYYPAACCCARYKTTGTKAFIDCSNEELKKGTGFWYLPACGELGYIIPRLYDINDTISKLNTAYGVGVQLGTSYGFWSSSESTNYTSYYVTARSGEVRAADKYYSFRIRAFMRLGPTQEPPQGKTFMYNLLYIDKGSEFEKHIINMKVNTSLMNKEYWDSIEDSAMFEDETTMKYAWAYYTGNSLDAYTKEKAVEWGKQIYFHVLASPLSNIYNFTEGLYGIGSENSENYVNELMRACNLDWKKYDPSELKNTLFLYKQGDNINAFVTGSNVEAWSSIEVEEAIIIAKLEDNWDTKYCNIYEFLQTNVEGVVLGYEPYTPTQLETPDPGVRDERTFVGNPIDNAGSYEVKGDSQADMEQGVTIVTDTVLNGYTKYTTIEVRALPKDPHKYVPSEGSKQVRG